jgi:hypothetical protein
LPELHPCGSKTEPQAVTRGDNSHVSNILPLTTFGTIDLGGKEFPDPLFSRFCAKMRVFFEENPAPDCVQKSPASGLERDSRTQAKTGLERGNPQVLGSQAVHLLRFEPI